VTAVNTIYPATGTARDRWIETLRPPRSPLDARRPYAFFVEEEHSADGQVEAVATVFLTNRECPWRCAMCDLWRHTLSETVPAGAIPAQIDFALQEMASASTIKLYNSGSFFDPRAIPPEDYGAIAERIQAFKRVIVECHPALIGERCLAFRDILTAKLEVAMGLETVNPEVLEKLNKKMTLDQFAAAAAFLRRNDIDLRVFILIQPPFMNPEESLYWAQQSLQFAFDCGATVATLIPTRGGNGAMEVLAANKEFVAPPVETIEAAMRYGLSLKRGRVFVDLWNLKADRSYEAKLAILKKINLEQRTYDAVSCEVYN
jgi:archaeosine synthase beta-subunit